jgi:prephenate dehydrogenase
LLKPQKSKAERRKVLIVGGTGKMGQWFSRFFKNQGFEVAITSRKPSRALKVARMLKVKSARLNEKTLSSSDVVLLSVPPSETAKIISDIASKMRKNALLLEISSVKINIAHLLEAAAKKYKVNIVSLHPMFGPGAKSIHGYRIIIIPVKGCRKTAKEIAEFFKLAGAKVVLAKDFTQHEKMTALTLALPHFVNLFFGLSLALSKCSIREVSKYGGTTFTLQKILCESVISEDPKLYSEIQMFNRKFKEILPRISQVFLKLKETVEKNDVEEFGKAFRELQSFFSADQEYKEAYKLFYRALEAARRL